MPHQRSAPRSAPVACPICKRPLKLMPDRWLAEFECDGCGPFSDFAGAALVSEQRHRSHLSLPHESAPSHSTENDQDHEDDNDPGGTPA